LELVALTLAYGYDQDNEAAWEIPDAVWDGLFARGLIQSTQDYTGEYTTTVTQAGVEALLAAIKEETSRAAA
jgi:hypothetical protein